jgi:putative glutamine amidotransferase
MTDAAAPLIVVTASDPAVAPDPALAARKSELYAAAVAHHGANAVVVTPATPPAERERLLGSMAGLLLSGGADIDPRLYGEPLTGADGADIAESIDVPRDELELAAWREAERRALPVLGICRGLQAINVFSGGKLLQDVPSHKGTPYGQGPAMFHDLGIEPHSRLGRAVAGASPDGLAAGDPSDSLLELQVNTFHHQAVNEATLAPSLLATAWAWDDEFGRLVEGLESRDHRWLVGIQCHPERTDSTPDELEGLFEDFVLAARAVRG